MNKNGQMDIIRIIFYLLIGVMFWALIGARLITEWSGRAIASQGLSGIEAFLLANLNVWIAVGLFISILVIVNVTRA